MSLTPFGEYWKLIELVKKNCQGTDLIVKLLKLSVFTISHASFGRAIDHQEGMAFVDGHGLGGTVIHHHIELVATLSRHCDSSIGNTEGERD